MQNRECKVSPILESAILVSSGATNLDVQSKTTLIQAKQVKQPFIKKALSIRCIYVDNIRFLMGYVNNSNDNLVRPKEDKFESDNSDMHFCRDQIYQRPRPAAANETSARLLPPATRTDNFICTLKQFADNGKTYVSYLSVCASWEMART
ncbi:hypothetical protein DBV15_04508 [Temnothorax longispinosus]|uniref:Uncharacterized protein n=1 Tax=Temnothorax longispinosus TaxID=300112 RepID=A0A4S2KFZ6_9HYME|nr:hypothetical protein DBV15_04508 [Temnothorax longispinosus]